MTQHGFGHFTPKLISRDVLPRLAFRSFTQIALNGCLYGFFIPHQHPNAAFAHSMPHELGVEVLADGLGGGATALGRRGKAA